MRYTRGGRKKSNRRTRKVLTHLPLPLFRSVKKLQRGGSVIWQTMGEYAVESIVGVGNDEAMSFTVPTRVNSNGLVKVLGQDAQFTIGQRNNTKRGVDTSGNAPFYTNLLPVADYNTITVNSSSNYDKVTLLPTAGGTVTIPVPNNLSYVPGNYALVYRDNDAMNTNFTGKVISYTNGPTIASLVLGEIANIKGNFSSANIYKIIPAQPYTPIPTLYAPLKIAVDSAGNICIIEDNTNGNSNSFRVYSTSTNTMRSYGRYVGQLGAANNPNDNAIQNFAVYRNEGLTIDKKSDVVFITDWSFHHIRSITQDNKLSLSGVAGQPENGGAYNVLRTNANKNRDGGRDSAGLKNPSSIAIDPRRARGYVCDTEFLMMIDMTWPGNVAVPDHHKYYFSRLWKPPGQIHDMVVDTSGNIFALCCGSSAIPLGPKRHAVWKIVPPPPGNTIKYNRTVNEGTALLDQKPLPAPPAGMPPLVEPTIFAGHETDAGYVDGVGENTRFYNPMGISIDSKNNLYIADATNNVIRCITPKQEVFTIAGAGGSEYLGGPSGDAKYGDGASEEARFSVPISVTVDNVDNIYVLDRGVYGLTTVANNGNVPVPFDSPYSRIRKLIRIPAPAAPTAFTLVASDSISATFTWTGALTGFENKGYSAYYRFLIKPSASSPEVTYAIDGTTPYNQSNRAATASKWITDNASNKVQQGFYLNNVVTLPLTPNTSYASIKLVAFNNTGANASAALTTVVTAPASKNYTVFLSGTIGKQGFVNGSPLSTQFREPRGLAADAANTLYIADRNNHCIRKVDASGVSTTFFGTPGVAGTTLTTLYHPMDVRFSSSGSWPLYVADTINNRVLSVNSAGIATVLGTSGVTLQSPAGITVDTGNNVYVTSMYSHCIYMISSAGVIGVLAGSPGEAGSTDGPAGKARFNSPTGIHFDKKYMCLYVCDTNNSIIRKIVLTPAVTVFTLAGKSGSAGSTNGMGSVARFNGPAGLTSDLSGNLYVCDMYSHMIRKISIAGLVSTYSGKVGHGAVNGSAEPTSVTTNTSTSSYHVPHGICSGASGFMFVSELGNHCIRLLSPYPAPIAPTSLVLSAVTKDSATISWSGDSGTKSYSFTISPSSASIVIPTVPVGTTTAKFTGLTESTVYTINLILTNEVGSTFPPSVVCMTMIDPSSIKLETPGKKSYSLRGTPSSLVTGILSWSGLTRAPLIGYTLTPAKDSSGASRPPIAGIMPANQRSPFSIVGLEPNTTYSAKITGILPNFPQPTTGALQPASATHIRFTVTQVVGGPTIDYSVSSFSIVNGTSVLPWPAGTTVYPVGVDTTTRITVPNPADGGPQNLLNTSTTIGNYTPWYPRGTASRNQAAVVFALGAPTVFTGYRFAVSDAVNKTPNRWKLEYSTDGINFIIVDDRTAVNQTMPNTVRTYTSIYPLQIPDTATSNEVSFTTDSAEPLYISTIAGRVGVAPSVTTATATPSPPLSTQLNTVRGIAQDPAGNIYVASVTCILKLSPPATQTPLYIFDTTQVRPTPIPIPSTTAGLMAYTISLFAGTTAPAAPSWTVQTGSAIRFNTISAMIYSTKENCLYVSDIGQAVVVKVTVTGTPTAKVIAGTVGWGAAQDGMPGTNKISVPKGLAETADGTLFICDFNHGIRRLDTATGNLTTVSRVENDRPADIVAFPDGSLYYSSQYDHTIRKITPNPADPGGLYTKTIFAGTSQPSWSSGTYVDGPLLTARFNGPQGLTVDSNYTLYVYDSSNYAIRVITGGNVYTMMGGTPPNPNSAGNVDGVIANARVTGDPGSKPTHMTYTDLMSDPNGNLYLSDFGNGTIRFVAKFLLSQVITEQQLNYYKASGSQASSATAQTASSALAQRISGSLASSAVAQVASRAVASSAVQTTALSGPVSAKNEVVSNFKAIKTDLTTQTGLVYSTTASATAKAAARTALATRISDVQQWLETLEATSKPILAIAPMYQDRALQFATANPYLQSVGSIKVYDAMRKAYITVDSTTGHIVPNLEVPSRRPFISGQKGPPAPATGDVWSAPLATDILLSVDLTLPADTTWRSYFDPVGRRYFYVNTATKVSQYDHPFMPKLSSLDQIVTDTTTDFLPAGWVKLKSADNNIPYYFNTASTERTWIHPAPPPNPSTSSLVVDASLFPTYKKYISTTAPTTGKAFYVHAVTNEAQWNFPDSAFNVGPSTAQQASSARAQTASSSLASSATAQQASSATAQIVSSARAQTASSSLASSATAQTASSATAQIASSALRQGASSAVAQRASSALAYTASSALRQEASSAVAQIASSALRQGASSAVAQRASSALAYTASSALRQGASSAVAQVVSSARAQTASSSLASSATAQEASSALASSATAQRASSALAYTASSALRQGASSAVAYAASSALAQVASSAIEQRLSGAQRQIASSAQQQQASSAQYQTALAEVLAIKDTIKGQMQALQLSGKELTAMMHSRDPSISLTNVRLQIQANLSELSEKTKELGTIAIKIFELDPQYQDPSLQTIVKDDTLSSFRITKVFDTLRGTHIFLDANQRIVESPLSPAIRAYTSASQGGGSKQKRGSRKSSVLLYRI
jgi:sugar lactone lactonase YvrE